VPTVKELHEIVQIRSEKKAAAQKLQNIPSLLVSTKLERLTEDTSWDTFRGLLQTKIEKLKTSLEQAEAKLKDPRVSDSASLLEAKRSYSLVKAQLDAYEDARDLPLRIIEDMKELDVKPGVTEKSPNSGE